MTAFSPTPEDWPPSLVLRAALAVDFMAFTEFAFGVVRPNTLFEPNWHHEALAYKLSQVAAGEGRLIVTMPPRNLKSLLASVALPAWFLGHNPSERIVAVSYSDQLARSHANDFRRVVRDPIYQATFPGMRLARDTDREIMTTKRGKRFATSIEGTLTGLGGNLVIIDDPLKQEDAQSEAVRTRTIEWYRSTLLSRPDDKKVARIVLVMQRVHQDDLAGYLQEQGGFEILNLPAYATQTRSYELGGGRTYEWRRGELLHPAHEPGSVLLDLKRAMGSIAFSAQYQQSPIPRGGTIIKRKWLSFYDDCPPHESGDHIIMSWDVALSEEEKGDYFACVVLLRRKEVNYVLHVLRGRLRFDELKRKILDVKRRYNRGTLLIEDSPISKGLNQIYSKAGRFGYPRMRLGWKTSSPSFWPFRVAVTTTKSMRLLRDWTGGARSGAKERDRSGGRTTELSLGHAAVGNRPICSRRACCPTWSSESSPKFQTNFSGG